LVASRTKVAVLLVACAAFLWGYRGELVRSEIAKLFDTTPPPAQVEALPPPTAPVTANRVAVPGASVEQTLQGITGRQSPEVENRRSQYIEALSNKMREFQGDAPPPNAQIPVPAIAPAPPQPPNPEQPPMGPQNFPPSNVFMPPPALPGVPAAGAPMFPRPLDQAQPALLPPDAVEPDIQDDEDTEEDVSDEDDSADDEDAADDSDVEDEEPETPST
jgi:hypothetical protein